MPLLGHEHPDVPLPIHAGAEQEKPPPVDRIAPARRQSQHSMIAKTAIMSNFALPDGANIPDERGTVWPDKSSFAKTSEANLSAPQPVHKQSAGIGACLTDTPATTAPNSPRVSPRM